MTLLSTAQHFARASAKWMSARVHNLLYDSLSMFGVFGLGNKESLKFTPRAESYQHLNHNDKLYRKVR